MLGHLNTRKKLKPPVAGEGDWLETGVEDNTGETNQSGGNDHKRRKTNQDQSKTL